MTRSIASMTQSFINSIRNTDIYRVVMSDGVGKLNYSTEEQLTGRKNENGEPTYEITILGVTGSTASMWNNVGYAIPDFGDFVSLVRGYAVNTQGSHIPHGTFASNIAFSLTVTSDGQLQEEHIGSALNTNATGIVPVIATIEYTKL